MSDVVFVDSNILVYAHDADAGPKRDRAVKSLRLLWESGAGRLSVQVLQEFYVKVTRKWPNARQAARSEVRDLLAWRPVTPDGATSHGMRSITHLFTGMRARLR